MREPPTRNVRGLAASAALGLALLLTACGAGSDRHGTDLVVTGSGPSAQVLSGSTAKFTMKVANRGDNTATDVSIVNAVGNQLALTAIACTSEGGASCPATSGPTMTVPSIPAGGSLTFEVSATVGSLGADTIVITNTMSADIDDDIDRSNNSATAQGSAYRVNSNVVVTGSGPASLVAGGAPAEFAMSVRNDGPDAATGVHIVDTVGGNLTLTGVACTATGGAVCPATLGVAMDVDLLPVGGQLDFVVATVVDAGVSGTIVNTMSVTTADDPTRTDNVAVATGVAYTAEPGVILGVSQTGAATVSAGGTAVFTAVVSNPGTSTATNVEITETLTSGYTATVSCTASLGATCPASLGSTMQVPSLGVGRYLTFTFEVAVPSDARGEIVNTVQATADGDPDPDSHTATVTTVAVDARSGTYKAFAANGREYEFTIDFDAGHYTMVGNGSTVQRSFTAGSNGDFTVSGTSRFRVATDLVVGGHDFGGGVLPYVAARSFVTSTAQIGGLYNLVIRNVPDSGAAVTRPGIAQVSGNLLQICQSDTQISLPEECSGSALTSYSLTVSGDVFTGVNVNNPSETYGFRVARSGAASVLISAGLVSGSRQLRIALPDASALAGGVQSGASTTGDWVTITLSTSNYAVSGVIEGNDIAPLVRLTTGRPFSMLAGLRASDSQRIYVMQAIPLTVAFGAPNATGTAAGLLQVALP